jgi:hypothetical protein
MDTPYPRYYLAGWVGVRHLTRKTAQDVTGTSLRAKNRGVSIIRCRAKNVLCAWNYFILFLISIFIPLQLCKYLCLESPSGNLLMGLTLPTGHLNLILQSPDEGE